ncbi:MAG TPA: phosphotransferase family protein, partial [Caulobacteraceae bacterium]
MSGPLSDALATYLGRTWGEAVVIDGLSRISGGASRETYRFDALVGGERRPLILRRDPPGSLIETDRRSEFLALKSFHGRGVAAPEPLILEDAGAELERPFFIMARIDGGRTGSPFQPGAYDPHAAKLGEDFFGTLGRIAGADVATLPLAEVFEPPALDACWRRELDYWSGVIEADELHPQPIVRAAIRWLARNPPPPAAKLSVVHGDYRSGNFLHDGEGRMIAVLDWEMVHLGDPLEDLGWA